MKSIKILVAISLLNLLVVTYTASLIKPKQKTIMPNSASGFSIDKMEGTSSVPSTTPSTTTSSTEVAKPTSKPNTPTPTQVPTSPKPNPSPTTSTVTPNPSPVSTPTPTPTPTPDNRCLIQIDGATYDVTTFRNIHSGGDIFSCGTDMSQIFWSQHNQRIWNRMQQYRI